MQFFAQEDTQLFQPTDSKTSLVNIPVEWNEQFLTESTKDQTEASTMGTS